MGMVKTIDDFIKEALASCNKGECLWQDVVVEVINDLMQEYGWANIDENGCSTIWCLTTLEWIYQYFNITDKSIKHKKMSIFLDSLDKLDFDEYWNWYYEKLRELGLNQKQLAYFVKIIDVYGQILCKKIAKNV